MRIRKIIFAVAMAMLGAMLVPSAAYAYKIKSGDYVYLGTYGGERIIWRAIGDAQGDSLKILSDKILSLKAFDARRMTSDNESLKRNGSSRWSTSSIRSWLNSSSITLVGYANGNRPANGAVTINEYDSESGFLSGFSTTERGYIKKVKHSSALNMADEEFNSSGSTEHVYVREADSAGSNIASAYLEETEDFIYLPSSAEIEYIRNNFRTLGTEYHKALPTGYAISNSFLKYSGLRTDNAWHYWLIDAMEGASPSLVREVTPSSTVEYAYANDGIVGVRPMCTIDTDLIGIKSGNGTKSSPYVLFNDPWIDLDGSDEVVLSGSDVTLTLYKSNIPSGSTVEIYHNGVLADCTNDSQVVVEAKSGVNSVEIKVVNSAGNVICSSSYSFVGIELIEANVLEIDDTFDSDMLSFYHASNDASPYASFTYTTVDKNGTADGVLVMDSTQSTSAALATHSNKLKANYEYALVELDFMYSSFGDSASSLISLALNTGGSNYTWWSPLNIQNDGILNVTGVDIGKTQIGFIEKNVWYNIKVIVNNVKNTVSVVLTDERDGTPKILCYDLGIVTDFEYVYYLNVLIRGTNDSHQTLHLSTLKAGGAELAGSGGMIGNINVKSDGKTVRVFVKNTTEKFLSAKLVGAVYGNDGVLKDAKVCNVGLTSQNGTTYELPLENTLGKTDKMRIFLLDGDTSILPLTPSGNYQTDK